MTSKDRWGAGSLRQVQINWNRRMDRGRTIKDKEEEGEERRREPRRSSGLPVISDRSRLSLQTFTALRHFLLQRVFEIVSV